uniref:Large ribosomal subunit protein mL45 n=1 Tax=Moina brachiata TaxID=675436 RepID=A0A4Y7NKX4_9CRUS|nr:EOG090X0DDP [Moina brachiata]SVE93256.1 EOG090X0DDP [Moina brachiata]
MPVVREPPRDALRSSEMFTNRFVVSAGIQVRERHTKHWRPEFKKLRRLKVQKIELPNFNEKDYEKLTPDEQRTRMKEMGMLPPRPWMERPMFISSTSSVFEAYIPPEGDGRMSAISLGGAKQGVEMLSKKSKSMMAVRKIRSFDEDFETKEFPQIAQDIYIRAHEMLAEKNYDALHEYVTELSYPIMADQTKNCTVRWKFLKSLEVPRVVHVRNTDVITKENVFSQVTVRFHTQQLLAVYDRFGRLLYGSEVIAKDVLEYVVFEKHLANMYGKWRIHEKIIPDWMPPRDPGLKTYIEQTIEEEAEPATNDSVVPVTPVDKPATTAA